jgi:hypothetical protein
MRLAFSAVLHGISFGTYVALDSTSKLAVSAVATVVAALSANDHPSLTFGTVIPEVLMVLPAKGFRRAFVTGLPDDFASAKFRVGDLLVAFAHLVSPSVAVTWAECGTARFL